VGGSEVKGKKFTLVVKRSRNIRLQTGKEGTRFHRQEGSSRIAGGGFSCTG